jgi:hypothetical protein
VFLALHCRRDINPACLGGCRRTHRVTIILELDLVLMILEPSGEAVGLDLCSHFLI